VTTEDLYYPLRGETLKAFQTRGMSNVVAGTAAQDSLSRGRLLCVHTRSQGLIGPG
jgi:thiamine pyrophosphokinase